MEANMAKKLIYEHKVKITPTKALDLLEKFSNYQRPVKQKTVMRYAEDMKNNKWRSNNGTNIIFDSDGYLRDGQHRLWAVVESGLAIDFDIVRNVHPDDIRTIDIGNKRTGGDTLIMELKRRGEKISSAGAIASALNIVVAHCEHGNVYKKVYLTNDEQWNAFESHREIVRSASIVCKKDNLASKSICVALHYIFTRIAAHKILADSFFESFISGEGLTAGSPILVLRKKFIDLRKGGKVSAGREFTLSCIIKAWEAFKNNKKITTMTYNQDHLPVIKKQRIISGKIKV